MSLLIGDPGTAKSEFGKEILNLSHKAKIAVGKGSTGVGLTASAETDEFLGQRVLKAGTIPMTAGGHVVIDEVDKMNDEIQSHLLSAMENGYIKIDKSQVQGKLKANVGIFMIGNPKLGRFDNYGVISEQINLSPPLISRFDLIFPIRDIPEKSRDKDLVDTILCKHMNIQKTTEREVSLEFLRKYLYFAATHCKPKITQPAAEEISRFALEMRNTEGLDSGRSSVKITARQIEAIIRVSEAVAKLRLSDTVHIDDAKTAIGLMRFSLNSIGLDPETGMVDIDRVVTGFSASDRSKITDVKKIIDFLESEVGNMIPIEDIIEKSTTYGIDESRVEDAIERLKRTGDIHEPKRGFIQKI